MRVCPPCLAAAVQEHESEKRREREAQERDKLAAKAAREQERERLAKERELASQEDADAAMKASDSPADNSNSTSHASSRLSLIDQGMKVLTALALVAVAGVAVLCSVAYLRHNGYIDSGQPGSAIPQRDAREDDAGGDRIINIPGSALPSEMEMDRQTGGNRASNLSTYEVSFTYGGRAGSVCVEARTAIHAQRQVEAAYPGCRVSGTRPIGKAGGPRTNQSGSLEETLDRVMKLQAPPAAKKQDPPAK